MEVRYCENYYVCIVDAVENTKWKSSCHRAAYVSIDQLILQRILQDPIQHGVNLSNKLAPESDDLSFVPSRRFPQVTLSLSSY